MISIFYILFKQKHFFFWFCFHYFLKTCFAVLRLPCQSTRSFLLVNTHKKKICHFCLTSYLSHKKVVEDEFWKQQKVWLHIPSLLWTNFQKKIMEVRSVCLIGVIFSKTTVNPLRKNNPYQANRPYRIYNISKVFFDNNFGHKIIFWKISNLFYPTLLVSYFN